MDNYLKKKLLAVELPEFNITKKLDQLKYDVLSFSDFTDVKAHVENGNFDILVLFEEMDGCDDFLGEIRKTDKGVVLMVIVIGNNSEKGTGGIQKNHFTIDYFLEKNLDKKLMARDIEYAVANLTGETGNDLLPETNTRKMDTMDAIEKTLFIAENELPNEKTGLSDISSVTKKESLEKIISKAETVVDKSSNLTKTDLPEQSEEIHALDIVAEFDKLSELKETVATHVKADRTNGADYSDLKRRMDDMIKLLGDCNYFEILDISPEASQKEITYAYKSLKRQFASERYQSKELWDLKKAAVMIQKYLDEAFMVLNDTDLKESYKRAVLRTA